MTLSKRQTECLEGVAAHLDSEQIAAQLGISPHTVDGHVAAAVKALGARSRRDAVRLLAAIQPTGEPVTGKFPPVVDVLPPPPPIPPSAVHESRQPFDWPDRPPSEEARYEERLTHPLTILGTIVAIALALAILLLALDPLVQSAQRLANAIQPYH